jgi:hypothetical protein
MVENTLKIFSTVTQAPKILGAMNGVWRGKDMTKIRERLIHNGMVKSVLNYGAETWSLYEDDRRRIIAIGMDELR